MLWGASDPKRSLAFRFCPPLLTGLSFADATHWLRRESWGTLDATPTVPDLQRTKERPKGVETVSCRVRHVLILLASAAALGLPPYAVQAQIPAAAPLADKPPGGPTPLHPPMPALSADEIKARQGRGGGQKPDFNRSRRSDADKALPNPYVVNQAWYTMPEGRFLGGASAIDMDRDGVSVWIVERCGTANACEGSHVDPIMKFSPDGKVLKAFGHDLINYPHGMYVDRDDNIWVTDTWSNLNRDATDGRGGPITEFSKSHPGGAQVLKFSADGKLLLRLGVPGVYGDDETHLSQPSDVVTDKAGNIYVADGHDSLPANNRIV